PARDERRARRSLADGPVELDPDPELALRRRIVTGEGFDVRGERADARDHENQPQLLAFCAGRPVDRARLIEAPDPRQQPGDSRVGTSGIPRASAGRVDLDDLA